MGDVNMAALTAVVERIETVNGSAIALINGFADQAEQFKDDPVAIQALVDRARASADGLAAAVTANTPATTESTVPPAVEG
ncbi:MAG: hypothetical protein RLZZ373_859 [Pseudomonadota bacterium]|jgi:hypothetical protein